MQRRWSESVDAYVRRGVVVCCDKDTAHEERVAVHMTAALHVKATLHGGGGGASTSKPKPKSEVSKIPSWLCCGDNAGGTRAEDVKLILPNWKEEARNIKEPNNAASLALSVKSRLNNFEQSRVHANRIIEKFSHRKTTNLNLYSEIAALAACHDKDISQNLVKAVAHKLSKKLENPLVPLRTLEFIVMNIPKDHYDAYVMNQTIDIMTDIKGKLADSDEAIAGAMTSCFISVLYCMYLSGCRGIPKEKYDSLKADHTATLFENAQNIFKQSPSSKAEAARNKLVLEILKRIGDNEDPLLKNLKIGGELALGMIDIGMGVFSMDISLVVSGLSTVVSAVDKIDIQKKWFELYTLFRLTYPSGMEEVKNAWKETTDKMTGTIDESAAYSIIDYMHDRSHYVSEEQKKVIAKDLDELSKLEMWPTVAPRINLYIGTIKEQIYPPTPPSEEEGASNAKSEKKGPDPFPKALFEETLQPASTDDMISKIREIMAEQYKLWKYRPLIPLRCKQKGKDEPIPVSEAISKFIKSDGKVMLLTGRRGSGKTHSMMKTVFDAWCKEQLKTLFFYKRMGNMKDYQKLIKSILTDARKNEVYHKDQYLSFTDANIRDLTKESRPVVFLLDDFNIRESSEKSLWESNNLASWKSVKLIISLNEELIDGSTNYRKLLLGNSAGGGRGQMVEYNLHSLENYERISYFETVIENQKIAESQKDEKKDGEVKNDIEAGKSKGDKDAVLESGKSLEDELNRHQELLDLANYPCMLKILSVVLPRWSKWDTSNAEVKHASEETQLWYKIIDIWISENIEKMSQSKDVTDVVTLKNEIGQRCVQIAEELESDLDWYVLDQDEDLDADTNAATDSNPSEDANVATDGNQSEETKKKASRKPKDGNEKTSGKKERKEEEKDRLEEEEDAKSRKRDKELLQYVPIEKLYHGSYAFLHHSLREYFLGINSKAKVNKKQTMEQKYLSASELKKKVGRDVMKKRIEDLKKEFEGGQKDNATSLGQGSEKENLGSDTPTNRAVKSLKSFLEKKQHWNTRIPANTVTIMNALDSSSLNGIDLSGMILDGVDLTDANMLGTNFTKASLKNAIIRKAIFRKCNFDGCIIENSYFEDVVMADCKMQNAKAKAAKLSKCQLNIVDFTAADFSSSYMEHVDFKRPKFPNVSFFEAKLLSCKIIKPMLENTDFSFSRLDHSRIESCVDEAKGVNFTSAILKDATISGCEFVDSSFNKADFSKISISNTQFKECRITCAEFNSARLKVVTVEDNVDFTSSRFWFSILDDFTVQKSQLKDVQFQSSTMKKVKLLENDEVESIRLGLAEHLLEGHTESVLAVCFLLQETKQVETGSADGKKKKAAPSSSSAATSSSSTTKTDAASSDKSTNSSEKRSQYWLASAGCDATIRVWDLITGRLVRTLTGHEGYITCLSNVRRSESQEWRLASGSLDNTIRIWNVISGKEINRIDTFTVGVYSLCPIDFGSGKYGLASGDGDGKIRIYVSKKWSDEWDRPVSWEGHKKCVNSLQQINVTVGTDCYQLASGDADGNSFLWRIDDRKDSKEIVPIQPRTLDLTTKMTGKGTDPVQGNVSGEKKSLDNGDEDERLDINELSLLSICVTKNSKNEDVIATSYGGRLNQLVLFPFKMDKDEGKHKDKDKEKQNKEDSLKLKPKLVKILPIAEVSRRHKGDNSLLGEEDEEITYPDEPGTTQKAFKQDNILVNCICSLDGPNNEKWLAAAGDDGTIRIVDATTGEEVVMLQGHTERVYSVCAFKGPNDECWLASASADKTVRLWELADSSPPNINIPTLEQKEENEASKPSDTKQTSESESAPRKKMAPAVLKKFSGGAIELRKMSKIDEFTKKMFLAKGAVTFDSDFVTYCENSPYTRFQAYHMAKCHQEGDGSIPRNEIKSKEWKKKYENAR